MQELQACEAAEMQEDLRLVRAAAAVGAAVAAAVTTASIAAAITAPTITPALAALAASEVPTFECLVAG